MNKLDEFLQKDAETQQMLARHQGAMQQDYAALQAQMADVEEGRVSRKLATILTIIEEDKAVKGRIVIEFDTFLTNLFEQVSGEADTGDASADLPRLPLPNYAPPPPADERKGIFSKKEEGNDEPWGGSALGVGRTNEPRPDEEGVAAASPLDEEFVLGDKHESMILIASGEPAHAEGVRA